MAMTQNSLVVGVFQDAAQARQAIHELQHAGFSDDEIGYLTRASADVPENAANSSAATGAVEGGIIGVTMGAVASLLIPGVGLAIAGGILAATIGGAAIGAAAGGVIGLLTGMGVVEDEARFYQKELEAGRTIVTVKSESGYADAVAILRRNGSYDATTHTAVFNATPPQRPYGTPPETYDPTIPRENDEPPPEVETR